MPIPQGAQGQQPVTQRPRIWSLDEVKKELAERKLKEFVKQGWRIVEPRTPFIDNWSIDAICEHLQAVTDGEIQDLIINIPPRHMKSLTVSVMWHPWEWIRDAGTRWLFTSYRASLAVRDNVKARRIIQSWWYFKNWGHKYTLVGDQNAKERYDNDKGGTRMATSVHGLTGEGGDRTVVDDPHNLKRSETENERVSVTDWWDTVMSSRRDQLGKSARVIIMQRCHEADLTGHALKQGGYVHLCIPEEFNAKRRCITPIGWRDPRTKEGELLWPDRFPKAEVVKLRKQLGLYAYAAQYDQSPAPREGGIFKQHLWRFYHNRPKPKDMDIVIQSWDMAFKEKKTSDRVAGHVWGAKGADRYLMDRVCDIMSFTTTQKAVINLSEKWPDVKRKYVEDKANGPAIIDSLKRIVSGLIEFSPNEFGSKTARAHAVSHEQEAGNVWLPHPDIAPWVEEYIELARLFPNAIYDDDVDAMSQALIILDKLMEKLARLNRMAPPVGVEKPTEPEDGYSDRGYKEVEVF